MGNYSKLIASVLGAAAVIGGYVGIPEEFLSEEYRIALAAVLAPILVYIFPANEKPSA